MIDATFGLVLIAWALAGASPGPATLTIAGAAMQHGRIAGLATASGVLVGSVSWGIAAAFGMSALMLAHGWLVEVVRYVGAGYLLYLAVKAAKSALSDKPLALGTVKAAAPSRHFTKGLLIHLTNPKAIFAWGAIFAVVVPPGSGLQEVMTTLGLLILVSMFVFWGYGFLFSTKGAIAVYRSLRRWIEGGFAAMFGYAGFKILTSRGLS